MLIRSQGGTLIIRAHNVSLDQYTPTGKHALLGADGLDPEGIIIGIYDSKAEAEAALDYIFRQAAMDKAADLSTFKGTGTPKWLDEALNTGDGAYRP